jgi:hypothetical protein
MQIMCFKFSAYFDYLSHNDMKIDTFSFMFCSFVGLAIGVIAEIIKMWVEQFVNQTVFYLIQEFRIIGII